jgi:hypothetical protein
MTIEKMGTLTAILTAINGALYFLFKEFKKSQLKYWKKMDGTWTNEGDITNSQKDTHFIELMINVDLEDGEVTGTISSRNLSNNDEINYISVNGKIFYKSAKLKLSNIRNGNQINYGKAKISIDNKRIKWKLINPVSDFFPKRTYLHRTLSYMPI